MNTRRQKAIEIVHKTIQKKYIETGNLNDIGAGVDALLASDFCSDSVAELVKEFYWHTRDTAFVSQYLLKVRPNLHKLLRSIVEEK